MSNFNFPAIGRLLAFLGSEKIHPQKAFYPAASKPAAGSKESAGMKKAASILSIHRTIAVKLEELAKGLDVSSRSAGKRADEKKVSNTSLPKLTESKEKKAGLVPLKFFKVMVDEASVKLKEKVPAEKSEIKGKFEAKAGGKEGKSALAERKKTITPVPAKIFKTVAGKEPELKTKLQIAQEKPEVKQKQETASLSTTLPAKEEQQLRGNEKTFIPLGSQTVFPSDIKAKPFVRALQESAEKAIETTRKAEAIQPKLTGNQSAITLAEIAMKPIPSARMEIKPPPLHLLKFSMDEPQKQAVKADVQAGAVQLKQPRAEIMAFFELMPSLKMESRKEKKVEPSASSASEDKKEKFAVREAISQSQLLVLSRKEKVSSKPSVQRVEVFAGRTEDFAGQERTLQEASESAVRFASYSVPGIEKTSQRRENLIKTREETLFSKGRTVEETANLKKEKEGPGAWKDREDSFRRAFSAEEPAAKSSLKNTSEEIQKNAVRNYREDQLNISRMETETGRIQQAASREAPRYAAAAISEILKKSYRDDWSGDDMAAKLIALVMKASSKYTYSHSVRVADFSISLARELGIDDKESLAQIRDGALFRDIGKLEINLSAALPGQREEIDKTVSGLVAKGSFLHDIGKVKIPKEILLKEGKLTSEEQEILREHPVIGEQIVLPIPALSHAAPAIRNHHEWWSGKGYPDGLSGEDIPLSARIISIADAFDALISDRPYRKGMSVDSAKKLLKMESGTHFDPELVEIFIEMIEKNYHNVPVEVEAWS